MTTASPQQHPHAITMWDFSWLERRWPGAGYEDWDQALDELVERGYDAVRIDAYPHLVSSDPDATWELLPHWNQTSWGAQSIVHVQPLPALVEFVRLCADRDVKVALSTWYRQDRADTRMNIRTPQDQARIWVDTLRHLDAAGLLGSILFVDLCNEFPIKPWAPYLHALDPLRGTRTAENPISRTEDWVQDWMRASVEAVREEFPTIPLTFSHTNDLYAWRDQDVSSFDLLEPHVWMAGSETSDFNERVGYHFESFDPVGFDNLVAGARALYESEKEHWDTSLFRTIDTMAEWSRATGLGLSTTECWAVIDWKDWPGLDWDWVMDLNARAVERVCGLGRWTSIATSNFCGPQFVGMWRDVAWHQRLTSMIRSAPIDADIAEAQARRAAGRGLA